MTVYALYNAKGGVGKTTSAVNLAYLSARAGKKTLLWDLDPQGSASFFLGAEPDSGVGSKALIRGRRSLDEAIRPTPYENLLMIPADISARKLDVALAELDKPGTRLRSMLDGVARRFDAAFLDSPPGFSILADNLFAAADSLLVPMIPTPLSVRTFLTIVRYSETKGYDRGRIAAFFTLVDGRRRTHREILSAPAGNQVGFLKTSVPYSSEVELMGARRVPLFVFAAACKAAKAYEALWEEIRERTERGEVRHEKDDAHRTAHDRA